MQRTSRRDGIGNFMLGEELECFARIVRDCRFLVQERAIEVKEDRLQKAV